MSVRYRLAALAAVAAALGAQAVPAGAAQQAPDFSLVNQDGRRVTLRQFRGRVVLMNSSTRTAPTSARWPPSSSPRCSAN
ncbi:MAG: hypothetical protein QN162_02165 [Armatimonadota bacterium]|nr:hypothetical protein [Armatimonadota bacterium]